MRDEIIRMFKEALQYLGAKNDQQTKEIVTAIRANQLNPQKVELDLTSKAIEKLQDSSQIDIQNILKQMKEIAGGNSKDMTRLSAEVAKLVKAVESESSETYLLKTHSQLLRQILSTAEKMLAEEKKKDDKESMAKLDAIVRELKANKPEKVDLKPLVSEMKVVSAELKTLNRNSKENKNTTLETKIDELTQALTAFTGDMPKMLSKNFPKTFKLDDMQVRKIASGGAGVQTRGATSVTIGNTTLTTAGTEYSYTFPANTVSWRIKVRNQAQTAYYSYATGTLPGGTGTSYITLQANWAHSQDGIEWSNKTIYLEGGTNGAVVEIESYQL